MNFELRFWTYQEAWFQLKSDVAVHFVKALREVNIEIPFPQRDLHIRSISAPTEESLVCDKTTIPSPEYAVGAEGTRATPRQPLGLIPILAANDQKYFMQLRPGLRLLN